VTISPPSVSRGWIAALSLASLGLWMGYFGPLEILLPDQVQHIDSVHKAISLGVVAGVGAFVTVAAVTVAGSVLVTKIKSVS
jgi:hypothetical protein